MITNCARMLDAFRPRSKVPPFTHQNAAIIGAGPAGLMAAETLGRAGLRVTIYDRMPSPGRKFLLAGRGGLNLTHSEDISQFLGRYRPQETQLGPAIKAFPPTALRAWCEDLGQPVFLGTSGRVFPRAMKASPLLRAWLERLSDLRVEFRSQHRWIGWDGAGRLIFETGGGMASGEATVAIFALGGASWPRLGSDGGWTTEFARNGIGVAPLKPSNCGFKAEFSEFFLARFEGRPLTGIELSFEKRRARGEAVITKTGLEGGAIYVLSSCLRDAILSAGYADIAIDFRPGETVEQVERALSRSRAKQSMATFLRKTTSLAPVAIGLLHEAARGSNAALPTFSPAMLACLIKRTPVRLTAAAPIEKAISTAGGVKFEEIDECFMLRNKPGNFVAGEMLDWEAPTGGYLLQACFSSGVAAARGALAWLDRTSVS